MPLHTSSTAWPGSFEQSSDLAAYLACAILHCTGWECSPRCKTWISPFTYHRVQPICMSMSRCFRKTTCIYKVCLLRFQTFLSGCLTSLSRKEPLYCNLFKTAVLLSLTDHFIYLKTTLHGKKKSWSLSRCLKEESYWYLLEWTCVSLVLIKCSILSSVELRDKVWSWALVLKCSNICVTFWPRDSEKLYSSEILNSL